MLTYSRKLMILLIFHACWGIALWLSISKYGLGVSTDSTAYMFTGVNWIEGNGLVDYSGVQYILWPPLYPMLIGFLHLTGLSAFAAATVIQFTAFALIAYFSSIFFLKIFEEDFLFALLGAFLLDTGGAVISTFHMVSTDYLFSLFPILFALLIHDYAERQKWTTLTLIALTVSLAMLTRYLGYALVLTALMAVLVYSKGSTPKRILRTAYVGLFSIPPFLWMLQTWSATADGRRAPLTFEEYFSQFTLGMMGWFRSELPRARDLTTLHYLSVWGFIALAIILLFLIARKARVFSPLVASTLGFGLIYTLALFGNALISYFNRLWGRFQLPFYFPLVVLFLVVIGLGLHYLRRNNSRAYYPMATVGLMFLVVTGTLQFNRTIGLMRGAYESFIPENGVNTRGVYENSVMQYWKENPPAGEFRLFSNYTALVAFHTRHDTDSSPRKSGVYDETIIPLESYKSYMFSGDRDVYLIWIEPNTYEHVYLPHELAPIARIEVIIENEDGGIYLLRPAR